MTREYVEKHFLEWELPPLRLQSSLPGADAPGECDDRMMMKEEQLLTLDISQLDLLGHQSKDAQCCHSAAFQEISSA